MRQRDDSGEAADSLRLGTYETPVLVPIGNLRDVVANTTQALDCDGPVNSGTGDHSGTCGD